MEMKTKPICLTCSEMVPVLKEFNIKRPYDTNMHLHLTNLEASLMTTECLNAKVNFQDSKPPSHASTHGCWVKFLFLFGLLSVCFPCRNYFQKNWKHFLVVKLLNNVLHVLLM